MMSSGSDLKNIISCKKKRFLVVKLCFFPFNLYLWIRIRNPDPDPRTQMNQDPDPHPWEEGYSVRFFYLTLISHTLYNNKNKTKHVWTFFWAKHLITI